MKELYKLTRLYGLVGIWTFIKISLGRTKKITLSGIKHPILLRKGSSDIQTFYQVFANEEYKCQIDGKVEWIIDAGANVGLGAVYFANRYPEAKIISIEPESSNYKILKLNTRDYPSVQTLKRAVFNSLNCILVVEDRGAGNWGFITKQISNPDETKINGLGHVASITLDEIMNQYNLGTIDILKLDVEGAEKDIFSTSASSWLPKTKCLIIELHDNVRSGTSKVFFKEISKYNFSFSHIGENLIFMNNDLI